mmetsp:Transcript_29390/g.94485  ORF Transcript_29390/g.94485 Transcript_29390/m.94485 type:complete len:106 (-) Transcript_29390:215-532(-)
MSGEQRGERGGPSALLSGLPVRDANAFAQRKLDAASFPVTEAPTYLATHDRTSPPPDQVVGTETTNIILRHFRQLAEKQRERQKRAPPAAEAARKTAKLARPTSQ